MTRASKQTRPVVETAPSAADADAAGIVQVKIWLLGISPMVWRRVLVPSTCTLRELHGVIQVAMGWEGIHLYQFCLRSRRYGSWEVSASSPDVTLAALKLRRGARFTYEYDLNIPWRHEVRIEENRLEAEPGKALPRCTAGDGACPSEDCGGPADFMAGRTAMLSLDAIEDIDTMAEIVGQVVLERRTDLLDDEDTRWRLEDPEREQACGHRVPQQVRVDALGDPGGIGHAPDDLAHALTGQSVWRRPGALLAAGEQRSCPAGANMEPEQLGQVAPDRHLAAFAALAVVDRDHALGEADVLDPELDKLARWQHPCGNLR